MNQSTKNVNIKSYHSVYVPSSELRLSQPLPRQRVCPSPQNRGGGHLACGWGVGGVPIPTTGEKAYHYAYTLCGSESFPLLGKGGDLVDLILKNNLKSYWTQVIFKRGFLLVSLLLLVL